jgi:predicted metal-binding protein
MAQHIIFVCKSCAFSVNQRDYQGQRGGYHLLTNLLRQWQGWVLQPVYKIEAVECLSACQRACTIALAASQKTTLMFGDLPPLDSTDAILHLAAQYHASSDGLIPRQERPQLLQKGILARIPPLP